MIDVVRKNRFFILGVLMFFLMFTFYSFGKSIGADFIVFLRSKGI